MDGNINNWTQAECFLFGAWIAGSLSFFRGTGGTGKRFEFVKSFDGGSVSAVEVSDPDEEEEEEDGDGDV